MNVKELYQKYSDSGYQISTDTRNLIPNSIFFALKGENFNANTFAEEAIQQGCSYSVVDQKEFVVSDRCILVNDSLKALQDLANFHRNQFSIPVIGITGTNGKTTTKELINTVLGKKFKTHYTKGNFNNHIGVPLTLLSMSIDSEIAIIEMGANHLQDIDFLCNISEPNYGIITNIGKAHLEGFGSAENVVKTKNELYQFIKKNEGHLFVNFNNELLNTLSDNISKTTYGEHKESDTKGVLKQGNEKLEFLWNEKLIQTNLIGSYNFENAMAAICIGSYFKVSESDIKSAVESYMPTNNRSQLIEKQSNSIILDAYNANPTSMKLAIDNLKNINTPNKIAIIGQMNELGNDSIKEHSLIIDQLKNSNFNQVFLIGSEFLKVDSSSFNYFDNVKELCLYIENNKPLNQKILIKGSRSVQLEKVLEVL